MQIEHYIFLKVDAGDYIFILLAVVAAIAQAFNKKKAGAQPVKEVGEKQYPYEEDIPDSQPAPTNRSPFDPFLDIWEEEPAKKTPNVPVEIKAELKKYVSTASQRAKAETQSFVKSSVITPEEYAEETKADHRALDKKILKESSEEISQHPLIQKYKTGFSLRKAVIYSEILNRKY